jgi:hypothetical protein
LRRVTDVNDSGSKIFPADRGAGVLDRLDGGLLIGDPGAQITADAVCVVLGRAGFVVVAAAARQQEGERETVSQRFTPWTVVACWRARQSSRLDELAAWPRFEIRGE